MAKVEEVSTADQREGADAAEALAPLHGTAGPEPGQQAPFAVQFYRSAVGKKWVMAITGSCCMGFVLAHMIGNLKLFLGKEEINLYGECAARHAAATLLPRTVLLWILRIGADRRVRRPHPSPRTSSTRMNQKARPDDVPVAARLRRRQLRVAHDALDRHHRRRSSSSSTCWTSRGAPPTRTSSAATRTTTSSTASQRRCRSRSSTSSRTSRSAFHLYHGAW